MLGVLKINFWDLVIKLILFIKYIKPLMNSYFRLYLTTNSQEFVVQIYKLISFLFF